MKIYKFLLLPFIFFSLASCMDKEVKITEIETPDLVAIAFFNALYNEKDVKKAASVCDEKLSRIILHYQSPQAVARHLFNMSYDKVEIRTEDSGVKVREQFNDEAIITLYFLGTYGDDKFQDVKRISLIQVGDRWLINKILKDPF